MKEMTTLNPWSGRQIKIGGTTYNNLIRNGLVIIGPNGALLKNITTLRSPSPLVAPGAPLLGYRTPPPLSPQIERNPGLPLIPLQQPAPLTPHQREVENEVFGTQPHILTPIRNTPDFSERLRAAVREFIYEHYI